MSAVVNCIIAYPHIAVRTDMLENIRAGLGISAAMAWGYLRT